MNNYDLIINAEEQFAREVTFGVLYQRPMSVWHYLIPGMFLIDFLRRGTAIRRYTETFIFPRKLALQAAHDLLNGHESTSIDEKNQAEIYNWLDSHHLLSPELSRAQKTVVDVLAEHYTKLLQADGDSYDDLIEAAYTSRHDFQDFIHQIHTAEKEVDRAILTLVGDNQKLKEKLQLEEQQVAERRNRILETNY
jgi:uncharacterized protein (DUF1778 family)